MTDPVATGQQPTLEPVHAGGDVVRHDTWTRRLVLFLRGMACLSLVKGLYHWSVVCGIGAPTDAGFADYPTPYQAVTVFFAVIDLVAAVGLWLAAPWGAGGWLTSGSSVIAVELLFSAVYCGGVLVGGS